MPAPLLVILAGGLAVDVVAGVAAAKAVIVGAVVAFHVAAAAPGVALGIPLLAEDQPQAIVTTADGLVVETMAGALASTSADSAPPALVAKSTTPGAVIQEALAASLASKQADAVDTN